MESKYFPSLKKAIQYFIITTFGSVQIKKTNDYIIEIEIHGETSCISLSMYLYYWSDRFVCGQRAIVDVPSFGEWWSHWKAQTGRRR